MPVRVGRIKMNAWQRIVGHLGVWALHQARAFEPDPRYRVMWAGFFDYWQMAYTRSFHLSVVPLLKERYRQLHVMASILLPANAMTSALHYGGHMPDNMRIAGSLAATNMYRDERAGHTLTRASHACRGFEQGLAKSAAIRDLCSYLRVHDPELFDGEEIAAGGHQSLLPRSTAETRITLKDPRRAPIPALLIDQLELLFSPVDASKVNLFYEAKVAESKHRLYTIDADDHSSSVRFQIRGSPFQYGSVVGLFMFSITNDIRSPTITFLEILPWPCEPGFTVLPVLRRPDEFNTPTVIVRPCEVYPDTVLFLNAIPEDIAGGSSHNVVSLDPLPLSDLKSNPFKGL